MNLPRTTATRSLKELKEHYAVKKTLIKKRLRQFSKVWEGTDKDIFIELCFCICTPQSRAVFCDRAVKELASSGGLFKGNKLRLRKGLKGVRFPNNKAGYIKEARERFCSEAGCRIKEYIDTSDLITTRNWLVKNVKGLGYKEASHFLRNIGQGSELAILDVHIMRNLKEFGLIKEVPPVLSRKRYHEIEQKVSELSEITGIPMAELDLALWSKETGEVFK